MENAEQILRYLESKKDVDTQVYFPLVRGYIKQQKIDDAWIALERMRDQGVAADTHVYNSFIAGYAGQMRFDRAIDLMRDMIKRHIKLDEFSFTPLISGLAKAGRYEKALDYYEMMLQFGLTPGHTLLNVLECARRSNTKGR